MSGPLFSSRQGKRRGCRWNAIWFGAAAGGAAGTLFGLVPLPGVPLERYLVWCQPICAERVSPNRMAFQEGPVGCHQTG